MTAGQIWQRPDGLQWVEIQNEAMEPCAWHVLVPLFDPTTAPKAPPLVVAVGNWHARVHLVTTAPTDELGSPYDQLNTKDLLALREAVHAMIVE